MPQTERKSLAERRGVACVEGVSAEKRRGAGLVVLPPNAAPSESLNAFVLGCFRGHRTFD
eukprot:scaffold7624_cov248-Pinguiococcus_pyrenoidosus.AAC.21